MKKFAAAALTSAAVAAVVLGGSGAASAAPATIPGTGAFSVGLDVSPGTYTTQGSTSPYLPCTWIRAGIDSNRQPVMIAYGEGVGPTTVTIEWTDAVFITAYCGEWTKVASPTGSLDFGSLDTGSLGS